ncbi:bacillithiol biosynthesis cysteine-adding enzyme BshC [Hymenobacter terrestris]|uniref:Putative cysteine ligase BshC n=1 Tax=Hymenobacter terrestris TaxID=2748310 RepID=A0ABX2Q822_9BACT|nr:bacillithiol biosynthesis cysteine-adding enzyme BshC [Hymenobacter terrestris]NVO86387.1 bacillithiol biosynthesis cysteine-adding enzyme BshC [Hymenobacter terrestris]
MTVTTLPYAETGAFSSLLVDYLARKEALQPFYHRFPELSAFENQIKEKQAAYSSEARQRLTATLQQQYAGLPEAPAAVQANLALLEKDTTFTVTTGHQLNLFTGPLYFIYKIVSAIKLAQQLKEAYPQYDFVPVYWLATEDHDFAEINNFSLFGKTYEWNAAETGQPVGRMNLNGLTEQVLDQLPADVPTLFREAYEQSKTLAEATHRLAMGLFGAYGLVSLDADVPELKQALVPVLERELRNQASYQAVQAADARLEAAGYKPQVYARPFNLFFITAEGQRERLEYDQPNDSVTLTVDGSPKVLGRAELLALAAAHPGQFSPNVVLRPLYQELLLPNLCYIGGGAEVAYWFQLKGVFEENGVPFPMVLLRNSAQFISKANAGKLRKLGLDSTAVFAKLPTLKQQLAAHLGQEEVDLKAQQQQLATAFEQVAELAQRLDPSLVKAVAAEQQKASGILGNLEKRLSKAAEAKHETAYQQLSGLRDKLLPGGGLQERSDNVLNILINNPDFIAQLLDAFDPLALEFTLLEEE